MMFNALSIISDSVGSVQPELTEMYEMEVGSRRTEGMRAGTGRVEEGRNKIKMGDDKV